MSPELLTMLPLELLYLMNCPAASEMCGHVQAPLHFLCGQHEEQQAEGHPECLETQPVSRQGTALLSGDGQATLNEISGSGFLSHTSGTLKIT
jgi:hypothetical protein